MQKKNLYILFTLLPFSLSALPVGEKVKSGSALFSKQESILQIEASDKAIIDFESFNIQTGEKVLFIQPKSSSTLLSRVQGNDPSQILGALTSNGKVFLVNPHGVYFGQDAIVDTSSLIVSTLDVLNEDFLQERYCFFSKPGQRLGEIRNEGILTAVEGSVVLIGPHIVNEGTIFADVGRVLLASAEKVTLDFSGDGLMAFAIDGIIAAGDLADNVVLGMSATQKIIEGVVNADGLVAGSTLIEKEGIISLVASSYISAQDIAIAAANVQLEGSLVSHGDIHVEAQNVICVRDSAENPFVLHVTRDAVFSAPVIDIFALQNQATSIASGGDMLLLSDSPISADAHFFAGGNFTLETLQGSPGDFTSIYDPIITSNGDVSFGNYNGTSLKVQAAGNINCNGTINITGVDTGACMACLSDPDCHILQTGRALILRSGTPPVTACTSVPPTTPPIFNTTFMGTTSPSGSTIYLKSSITGIETAIFDGTVSLTGNVAITANGTQPITFTGDIFVNTGLFNFSVSNPNGLISFGGDVGVLSTFTVTSAVGIEIGGNISTATASGAHPIVFTGPVMLTNNSSIAAPDAITFAGTLDSISTTPYDLTVQTQTTTVTLGGDVGSTHPLGHFNMSPVFNVTSTPGITINAEEITLNALDGLNPLSVGALTAGSGGILLDSVAKIVLNGDLTTADGPINLNRKVALANDITIATGGGDASFSSVDGGFSLTIDTSSAMTAGTVTFNGDIGVTSLLTHLIVPEGNIFIGKAETSIFAGHGIDFHATIDAASAPGTYKLFLHSDGLITLAGAIGQIKPLNELRVTSTTLPGIDLSANVTTSGGVNFTGFLNLFADVVIKTNGGEADFDIVNGAKSLVVDTGLGQIMLNGPIGLGTALSNVTMTSAGGIILVNDSSVFTSGNMIFNAPIDGIIPDLKTFFLIAMGRVTFNDNIGKFHRLASLTVKADNGVIIGKTLEIRTSGDTTFTSTIDSAVSGQYGLTIDAGRNIDFDHEIGGSMPLAQLTVSAGGVINISADITTSQNLPNSFIGAVRLGKDSTITPGGSIIFTGSINSQITGPRFLTILSNSHSVTFQGSIGTAAPLSGLSVQNFFALDTSLIEVHANEINFISTASGSSLTVGPLIAGSGGIVLQSSHPVTINSNLTTAGGPINLYSPAILTHNALFTTGKVGGDLSFISLLGMASEFQPQVFVMQIGGTATLGTMNGLSKVIALAGAIELNGTISAEQVLFLSTGSITNLNSSSQINFNSNFLLNVIDGYVGTIASPINVNSATGILNVGTNCMPAYFQGSLLPGSLIPSASSIPSPLFFNGVQIPTKCVP